MQQLRAQNMGRAGLSMQQSLHLRAQRSPPTSQTRPHPRCAREVHHAAQCLTQASVLCRLRMPAQPAAWSHLLDGCNSALACWCRPITRSSPCRMAHPSTRALHALCALPPPPSTLSPQAVELLLDMVSSTSAAEHPMLCYHTARGILMYALHVPVGCNSADCCGMLQGALHPASIMQSLHTQQRRAQRLARQ